MVKVIIVDSNTIYRGGIKTLLARDERFDVVGDYSTIAAVRPLLPSLHSYIFIADLIANRESGLNNVQFLKKSCPALKVVIITHSKDEFHIVNAVQDDVDAYISKDVEPEELFIGLLKVSAGQKYYSAEISAILINTAYRRQNKTLPFLTTKEKEIIRLLMDGYSSKQIASKLDVSPRTIHSHRANILSKFNLNNTTQLVTKIVEQKIQF